MLCSPFAELVATFVQHPTVPLWPTKTPKLPMKRINTTIGLRVSFLFVCEIAVQSKEGDCDAAHLILHSKGDEVRFVVSSYDHLMTLFSSTLRK